jgi:hypothetical protein
MAILCYQKVRKDGIISYLPSSFKRLLLSWSFFDLLCELFIVRNTFRSFSNIIAPFLECETKEKAKSYLYRLRKEKGINGHMYKMIFRKGILNNIPDMYRSFLVPQDEHELKKLAKI